MQPFHFNFIVFRFELLCRTVFTQDLNLSSSPPKYVSVLRELPNKLTIYENHNIDTRLDMRDANVLKSPSFLILFWSRNMIFFK